MLTVADGVAPPPMIPEPVQLNVAPKAVELAVIIALGTLHVIVALPLSAKLGGTRAVTASIIP